MFAKKSCSACIRVPSSFDVRLAKTAAPNFPALRNGYVRHGRILLQQALP
jgi:hypothetical protein